MAIIRDPGTLIGSLEQGQLHKDFAENIKDTIVKLQDLIGDNPKAKAKGSVTLKLDFTVQDGRIEFDADISTKTPKQPRRSTVFFLTDDSEISTEHPRQRDMFGGPNAVTTRASA
ncbi:hypothetical protein H4S14_000777 [Agrobacterium vitis]|nr:hypothetical protein [Agrobacterium vitis]MBE1437050.1 hypothetical protein [Agrobacterium vitis]